MGSPSAVCALFVNSVSWLTLDPPPTPIYSAMLII